jgi:nitrite reductase/ring-hydroxylating ferredoxin subunit
MGTEPQVAQPFVFCAAGELPAGRVRSKQVGGRPVAVTRGEDGVLTAFGALCPHQHADLAHGILEEGGITCPDHLWHFELPSGRCTSIPGAQLPIFPVREVGGEIIVEVVPR